MYLSSLLISIFSFPALLSFALIARSLIRVSTRLAVDQTPPDYDKCHYWDKRYTEESEDGKSFDWLFSYSRLRSLLSHLIPEKSCKALVIGCGTAPFSTDMYIDGYFNIINADYSKVAIDFQEYRYPFMRWMVVDALNTKLEDASVPCVIDKSGPFDSIMCGDKWYIPCARIHILFSASMNVCKYAIMYIYAFSVLVIRRLETMSLKCIEF